MYRRRYNLPINDPRYLDATTEEMLTDHYAHLYFENPNRQDDIVDDDFSLEDLLREAAEEAAQDDWEDLTPDGN